MLRTPSSNTSTPGSIRLHRGRGVGVGVGVGAGDAVGPVVDVGPLVCDVDGLVLGCMAPLDALGLGKPILITWAVGRGEGESVAVGLGGGFSVNAHAVSRTSPPSANRIFMI